MSLALSITALSGATLLNNHQFYSDGACGWALGTDGDLFIGVRDTGDNGCPASGYEQAVGTQGTTGVSMGDATSGHTFYNTQSPVWVAVDTCTSGSTLSVDTTDHTVEEEFKHIVVQAKVASDATRGAQSAETLTFQYDEV
jgi:hypothetical protein